MSYESHYESIAAKSKILANDAAAPDSVGGPPVPFASRQAVQSLINEYVIHNGLIPQAREVVNAWEERAAQHTRTMKALGLGTQVPLADDVQDSLDYARARHDVLLAERDRLYELRDSFGQEASEDRRQKILNAIGGLRVTTEYDPERNLYRTAFDHQCISLLNTITGEVEDASFNTRDKEDLAKVGDQHIVIVDDEASPFDGMSLQGYRGVCDEVKRQRNAMRERWLKENAQKPVDERESTVNIAARAGRYKPSEWPPSWLRGCKDYKASHRDAVATG